jgi:endoglycosylceramidase
VRLRRACAAVALALAALPAGAAGAAGSAAGPVGAIHPRGPWLADATGRIVIVHGLQIAHKQPPYLPPRRSFTDADARRIARWGFDAVRLAWFWKGLEPRRGEVDAAYAREIAREARLLQRRGVMVLLEAHQDGYNEAVGGAGFPDWATRTDGLRPLSRGAGAAGLVDPAQQRAFDHLYADTDGIAGAFADAWTTMARAQRRMPPRLGYDLFNEPYPGAQTAACLVPLGCPAFDRGSLGPLQDRLAAAVRRVDRTRMVWYEPHIAFDFGVASALGRPAPAAGPAGFAFHAYCLAPILLGRPDHESSAPLHEVCPTLDGRVFDNAARTSQAMGDVPPLFGEFGDTQDRAQIARLAALADARRTGWIYWGYKDWVDVPGGAGSGALFDDSDDDRTVRAGKVRTLSYPYPQATAGSPGAYRFDPATRTFTYRYAPDPAVRAPTVIFAAPLQYPHGYVATVAGAKVLSRPGAARLVLRARRDARSVSVRIAPRA